MGEQLAGTVRGWATCRSLALTVPRHLREALGFKKGDHFAVKTDGRGRIIYEKLPDERGCNAPTSGPSRNPDTYAMEASR
jgi:bifunctional DNA-binding transcriptional regulator/antitoxin component of YhaV-PrlF toxin-antitoxin module